MAATKYATTLRPGGSATIQTCDAQAFGNSGVVETRPVKLMSWMGANKGASTLYLMFFDATSVPSNGAVPLFAGIPMAAGAFLNLQSIIESNGEGLTGLDTTTGLCWAASTSQATLTVDTTNSVWPTIRYV